MKNIGIVGGGIIGLCSAYYLNKSGHKVTVIDQGDLRDGCSVGNAGMVVPSHLIPLAAPGMISKGIRWMFQSSSPFYIRPRLSGSLLKWGYYFYRSSTKENVDHAIPALKEISLLSKDQYRELSSVLPFDFGFQEKGLLMLYQTEATAREEVMMAAIANEHGIIATVMGPEEVQELEPEIKVKVRGGVYFPGDAHLTPQQLVNQLIPFLTSKGVEFRTQTEVTELIIEKSRFKAIKTNDQEFDFDELIIAAGCWSGSLCSMLRLSLPMQAGKGYSFTLPEREKNIKIPSILVEARVAVTPMGNSLRFGGTMEIAPVNHRINMNRVKGIVDAIPNYYPEMNVKVPKPKDVWHGFRPCSPDGLPYIGRLKNIENVTIASGHAMMGMSLGPGTGKLVAQIIDGGKMSMEIKSFDPNRFQ